LNLVSWLANAGRVLVLNLRVNVFRLKGQEWTITYIGAGTEFEYLSCILFPDEPLLEELPRVFLWKVPALIQQLSSKGDLVVCDLNKNLCWLPRGLSTSFIVPPWIRQVIEGIDQPPEKILASMSKNRRKKIRRLQEQPFCVEFSQDKQDFDQFYYRMYLPYVRERHEGQGLILVDYDSALKKFLRGGIILIREGHEPIGGLLYRQEGDTFYASYGGVLDGDYDIVKRGVQLRLDWAFIQWAHKQGARRIDFGSTRALTSDGVFEYKRQMGRSRVILQRFIYDLWSFYADRLPDELLEHLNSLGLITVVGDEYYRVLLLNPGESFRPGKFTREIKDAAACGLNGVAINSDSGKLQIIPNSQV